MTNKELQLTAANVRKGIVTAVHSAKSGHPGGSLSAADMFTYLYFEEMNIDPKNPKDPGRDRFVLSKGHTAPGLYSTLANRGYFPVEDLTTLRKLGSYLQGHPCMTETPGVDMSTGSLGQGVSTAVGMALAAKLNGDSYRVYTLTGDGEIQEGQIWEAAMAAGFYNVNNLIAFVDNNGLQLDGRLSEVMDPNPIDEKFRAFGWNAVVVDGHDVAAIDDALEQAYQCKDKPTAIVCRTIKGKGVSVFEDQVRFHGGQPTDEEWKTAFAEIEAQLAKWEA